MTQSDAIEVEVLSSTEPLPEPESTDAPTQPPRRDWPWWGKTLGILWLLASQWFLVAVGYTFGMFFWWLRILGTVFMHPDPEQRGAHAQAYTADFDAIAMVMLLVPIATILVSWTFWLFKSRWAAVLTPLVGALLAWLLLPV